MAQAVWLERAAFGDALPIIFDWQPLNQGNLLAASYDAWVEAYDDALRSSRAASARTARRRRRRCSRRLTRVSSYQEAGGARHCRIAFRRRAHDEAADAADAARVAREASKGHAERRQRAVRSAEPHGTPTTVVTAMLDRR